MGAGRIRDALPNLVEKVTAAGRRRRAGSATRCTATPSRRRSGYKTRRFDDVIAEVQGFFDVHRSLGTWPGGVHVELTGDDVTECVGGGEALLEGDLGNRYESVCDPRLNRVQSLELAFLVAEMLREVAPTGTRAEPPMIDLRSDTVTRPTEAMRAAMAGAEVGDDVYGEDPTVRALEERVAGAVRQGGGAVHPDRLDGQRARGPLAGRASARRCSARRSAHIARAELGAHGAFTGLTMRTWVGAAASTWRRSSSCSRPDMGPFFVPTRAVSVENTHNFGGGAVIPLDGPAGGAAVRRRARGRRARRRRPDLERARRDRHPARRRTARCADVLAVCLSKGLGAPVGSLVVGTAARDRPRRGSGASGSAAGCGRSASWRRPGLHALDHHVERLADDHEHARLLAEACGVDPAAVRHEHRRGRRTRCAGAWSPRPASTACWSPPSARGRCGW